MGAMDENDLLTVREAAARLGQGESTIRRKIAAGEILAVRLGQGTKAPLRVPSAWLKTWLFSCPAESRERNE
jgi:excisionase family DNA binding protein